ncbi:MAG: hypothetical protein EB023_03385 [Flavobacteriia bacterium]|nr:hypothetical protein [Flavobacteriia bacterium]
MKIKTFLFYFLPFLVVGQTSFNGSEIGVELFAGASNLGGAIGGDLKYAAIINENWAVGPSFRYQRTWSNNQGQKMGFSVYGGGVYAHYRIQNSLFLGGEFEMLRSPFNFILFNYSPKIWAPTLFLGGGFSRDFNGKIRVNGGIFYDVINADNSPFRSSYSIKIKDDMGQVVRILPIIYRITFFFPLGGTKTKE